MCYSGCARKEHKGSGNGVEKDSLLCCHRAVKRFEFFATHEMEKYVVSDRG